MTKRAADTNILVRILVGDDPIQSPLACNLLVEGDELVVLSTVLLEVEWVLRGVLKYSWHEVDEAFAKLFSLPGIVLPEEQRVLQAFVLFRTGMDFADALHLAGGEKYDEFVTFDRALARTALKAGVMPPVRLL